MKRHLLVKARRPVPSGRVAHSARVLPVRACFAHGRRHRLPVRGSALPGQDARHCSPPTGQLKILCPRNLRVTFARYSRSGHKLAGPDSSASAYIPRTGPVRILPIDFRRPHTFPVRVQSATVISPQPVRSTSGAYPHSVQWLACHARELCIVGLASRAFPKHVSSVVRGRAGCPLDFCSPPAAFRSLPVRWTFLLAFRVAFLASSGGRPNPSRRVLLPDAVVLPVGALAAAPGCVQMLRIFCLPLVRPAPACGAFCSFRQNRAEIEME
jgi:hypothetical protein